MAGSFARLRGAHGLHLLVVVLLLLSTAVLLGMGVWLQLLRPGGRYLSFYSSSWPFLVLAAVLGVVGAAQLLLFVCLRRRVHAAERAITRPPFVTAALLLVLLAAVAVVGVAFLARYPSDGAETEAERVWRSDVTNSTQSVCDAERAFDCRGFTQGECFCEPADSSPFAGDDGESTVLTNTTACSNQMPCAKCEQAVGHDRGCFDAMRRYVRVVLVPTSAVSAALALLLGVHLFATCCALDRAAPTEIQPVDTDAT